MLKYLIKKQSFGRKEYIHEQDTICNKAAVGRNTNINDLTVGKEIKVKVRVFDPEKNKLIVSMRDAEERVEKENFKKLY